jgi:hypothetical protein
MNTISQRRSETIAETRHGWRTTARGGDMASAFRYATVELHPSCSSEAASSFIRFTAQERPPS